jgi:hypothetical protein
MATANLLRWKSAMIPGRSVVTGIPNRPGGFAWIEAFDHNGADAFRMVIEDGRIRRKVNVFGTVEEAYAAAQTWANSL